ncbi:MAG: hypothetical protein JST00_14800 [Deltaproteobacteria bacterium]|nr:hypothetical protein [Deltaproteobacteria bacterium]
MRRFLDPRWTLALTTLLAIAIVWLNQSVGQSEWEALRDRSLSPGAPIAERLRYPFVFLYRRSGDEAIYHATASAVLGQPYDTEVLAQRGDSALPPLDTPADGHVHVPYSEVPFEYPPPNVPFVVGPRLVTTTFNGYAQLFCAVMGVLLVIAAAVGAYLGSSRGEATAVREENASAMGERDAREERKRLYACSLLLLAHGAIAIQRLDAIVAVLLVLVVHAATHRHDLRLGLWAGLAGAVKLVPILVLPVVVIAAAIRAPRRLARVAAGAALGLALGLGPMIALSPRALPLVLAYHGKRGLHVESTLGVLYGAAKAVAGAREASAMSFGSFNFHTPLSDALAKLGLPLTLGLVALVAFSEHRRSSPIAEHEATEPLAARTERIALALFASLVALWLGGKVFSPQYLTWAIPVVLCVPGRRGMQAIVALGVVLLLSQLYLRGFYDHVYNQWPAGIATMLVRLAVIVAMFSALIRRRSIVPPPPRP